MFSEKIVLILTIIAQVLTVLPLPSKLSLIFLTELEKDRRRTFIIKYIAVRKGNIPFEITISTQIRTIWTIYVENLDD